MSKETSRPAQLSEEFVQESSDEDQIHKAQAAGGDIAKDGQDIDTPDSDSDSDSKSDSEDISDPVSQVASDYASRKRSRNETSAKSNTTSKRQKRSTMRIPAKPFKAPIGFEPLNRTISTNETECLKAFSDLDGKQVWSITAPASLDLSEIKQLDIEALLKGKPILTIGGLNYGMQPAAHTAEVLLLPDGDSVVYKPSRTKISRSFQLRQSAELPEAATNGSRNRDDDMTDPRPVRNQPVGKLNYRYVPFGVVSSSGENAYARAKPTLLKGATQQGDGETVPSTPEGKKKKKKKRSALTDGPSI